MALSQGWLIPASCPKVGGIRGRKGWEEGSSPSKRREKTRDWMPDLSPEPSTSSMVAPGKSSPACFLLWKTRSGVSFICKVWYIWILSAPEEFPTLIPHVTPLTYAGLRRPSRGHKRERHKCGWRRTIWPCIQNKGVILWTDYYKVRSRHRIRERPKWGRASYLMLFGSTTKLTSTFRLAPCQVSITTYKHCYQVWPLLQYMNINIIWCKCCYNIWALF